jgi:hypothetical protein
METIIVSVVSMALIIISTLVVTVSTFQSANKMADAWKSMEERSSIVRQTIIRITTPNSYNGGLFDLTVRNEGNANLNDFPRWDAIIQRQSGNASYLVYSEIYPPGPGEWAVEDILITEGTSEVFDLNILNPGEQMTVSINPSQELGFGETARIIFSTPNGVTAQGYITRAEES